MEKTLTKFDPPKLHPVEESEAHYVGVHVPLARIGFMREPNRIAYITAKALKQYDATGGWSHRLTAWRFVTSYMEVEGEPDSDEDQTALSEEMRALVKKDIPHCLRELRRCPVDEEVVWSRTSPTGSSAKYLFEYDASLNETVGDAKARVHKIVEHIIARAQYKPEGLRNVTVNWIQGESEVTGQAEPGQLYTGKLVDTTKVAYIEFSFDSEYWGQQFFSNADFAQILLDTHFETAEGYFVDQVVEFDRRG